MCQFASKRKQRNTEKYLACRKSFLTSRSNVTVVEVGNPLLRLHVHGTEAAQTPCRIFMYTNESRACGALPRHRRRVAAVLLHVMP